MARRFGGAERSLKSFLLQANVFSLYRNFLRSTRPVPTMAARRETIAWFRDEIERAKHETDPQRIDFLLKHGRILHKQLQNGFSMHASGGQTAPLRGRRN
ncbi:hypothetical protein MVES_001916 [Malassezia vespertilionis]|uniref:LYR motif-containing protein 2 n=1 Tax=Malassezia vespertilionis TaxID=2020962 RepID=A0A2N1JC16_9BASI|nr:hypothetical protein MVES_001916 [Malassezia vespertilionis]